MIKSMNYSYWLQYTSWAKVIVTVIWWLEPDLKLWESKDQTYLEEIWQNRKSLGDIFMHLVHPLALLFILYLELSTCGMKCLSGILEPLCRWFWVPRLCRKWTVAEVDGKCIFDVGLLWDGWLKLWILDARNFIKLFIASACLGAICGWFNIAVGSVCVALPTQSGPRL